MSTNHVLMFPFYAQGHLTTMLHLAELISKSNHNIHITVINNNFYNFPVHTPHGLEHYSGLPNFRFLSLDIRQENLPRSFHELIGQEESRRVSCRDEYRRVLLEPIDGWPPVTCVVADGFVSLALDVPEELGIPIIILQTTGAAIVWFYHCIPQFLERNQFPFEDEFDFDEEVQGILGMEGILRRRDVPSFVMEAKCKNDQVVQYMLTTGKNLSRAKALIFNTVEAIELPTLSSIRSALPTTYTIAPLHRLMDHLPKRDITRVQDDQVDRDDCLTWLDSKPAKSVVYVSFGSTTRMSKDELLELWHGLADSGYPFLWALRKDLLIGSEDASVVEKLEEADQLVSVIKERGFIVGWAPQKEVLKHPAVGCFVTHAGWNSILESIGAGVPMVCWPFLGDHPMNCRFVSHVWKIGLDITGRMQRRVVEEAVKGAMDGDGALEMRKSVQDLAKLVDQSVGPTGSSTMNFTALVQHIMSFGV